jgi:2-polyprenyl-6-methoxyphenol hydroxylase-like FAD-dependent oxidoreductase
MRVVIIGGGIGGLAAALALRRKGIEFEVYEQTPELTTVGASIQLGPNAVRLLDELGFGDQLREIGVRPDAVEYLRWDDGTVLLHTELGAGAERYFGAPELDVHRAELQKKLCAMLPDRTVRLGQRVLSVQQDDGGVTVVLEDGTTRAADAAVAADGIRSGIRQQLVGAEAPVFSGTVVYRGVIPHDAAHDLHPGRLNQYWLGPRRHGVAYWISGGRELAINCAVQDAEWSLESWTIEAPSSEALPYFDSWHEPLLERIRRAGTLLRGAVFVRLPLDQWVFGRVALLGDAAHAMEPFQAQGAAQAVEDAYVLAECLAQLRDVLAGLARYETIRMRRGAELQESSSAAAGVFYLPDGTEQRERDLRYSRLHETLPWGPRQPIWEYDVRQAL